MISTMISGIAAEGILLLCLSVSIWINKHSIKAIIGKKSYKYLLLIISLFTILFIMQIQFGAFETGSQIRLYGLTKCIIAPFLLSLAFMNLCCQKFMLRTLIFIVIIFNVVYSISILFGQDYNSISYQLGSLNGGSSVALVVMPAVVFFDKVKKRASTTDIVLKIIFYISTIFFIAISDSATSQIILILQIGLYIFSYFWSKGIFRTMRNISTVLLIGILIFSILIATGGFGLDHAGLRTRVGIWATGYAQFLSHDKFNILFGTGNDIVQMLSKSLEVHNVFLEILFIYGMTGLTIFIISAIFSLRKCMQIAKNKSVGVYISMVSYFLIISMHPFYTGVFAFQTICTLIILQQTLFEYKNKYSILSEDV